MPIVIRAKPGTGPVTMLRVKYRRTPPDVGDIFKAKPCDPFGKVERYAKWEGFYCDGRRGDVLLLERM